MSDLENSIIELSLRFSKVSTQDEFQSNLFNGLDCCASCLRRYPHSTSPANFDGFLEHPMIQDEKYF